MMNGKRPVFVDDQHSIFFFPYLHIRFVEIPPASLAENGDKPVPDAARGGVAARIRPRLPSPRPTSRSTRTSCAASARSRDPTRLARQARLPTRVRVREGPGATLPAVPKNLVIVESPAKARTIERYLGADYRVLASYGHVRDLPENPGKGKFGVDVDHDFAPEYVISDDRRKQVADIEKAAKGADAVYLATDLDREGEAIAWHVAEAAHVPAEKTHRVTFSEITEPAIREAFAHPREIDLNLVDAQQTRRIVDRLVGYTLSPLLSRKVRGGLSAGRVQSVAVRLVVEREREIIGFTAREYWTIEAILATAAGETFAAELVRIDGEALDVGDDETADAPRRRPSASSHPVVTKVGTPDPEALAGAAVHDLHAPAGGEPQARLQPEADDVGRPAPVRGRRDRRGPRRPDHLHADRLDRDRRRGDGRGARGHRRALRPDVHDAQGPRLQDEVEGRPGGPRVDPPDELPRATRTRSPTRLKPEELRLYRLIWQRALASQMAPKELETTTIELADGPYELRALGDQGPVRRLRPRLHRGSRRRGRRRRGRGAGCRRWPRATGRASSTSRRPSTSPSRRRASPRRR